MEQKISQQAGQSPGGPRLSSGAVPASPVAVGPFLSGFLRLSQIVGDPGKGIPAIIPVSKSTWWHKCKTDPAWPQPVKLSARVTAWRASDVLALVDRLANETKEVPA